MKFIICGVILFANSSLDILVPIKSQISVLNFIKIFMSNLCVHEKQKKKIFS